MSEAPSSSQQRPSALGAFMRGAMSGLFSGVLMALVLVVLSPIIMHTALGGGAAALMIFASTAFAGLMGAKRAVFDAPHSAGQHGADIVPVPLAVSGPAMVPAMGLADEAPAQEADQPTKKNWVAETGRTDDSNTRIQQILANGSLSDKDRASAILASREAADQQEASRA